MKRLCLLVSTLILGMLLSACGGGGGGSRPPISMPAPPEVTPPPADTTPPDSTANPAYHLTTARFTTHQPNVLEQIGAHHAYARGLTGRGVRIGIEDSIVDYTQDAEFGNRIRLRAEDGAVLAYSRPAGDLQFSDVNRCRLHDPACSLWEGHSAGEADAVNSWVRQVVDTEDWPTRDDTVFIVDEFYDINTLDRIFRWSEVPTPYGQGTHGTIVASTAAGSNLGVAPGATIIPIAKNLTDDQEVDQVTANFLLNLIGDLSPADRRTVDQSIANSIYASSANYDIINRSFGYRPDELGVIQTIDEARWYARNLPRTLEASWQINTPDAEKTIVVYAAGNDGGSHPVLGAALPFLFSDLRGHHLAVAATNPNSGAIDRRSTRCGSLPSDWNTARDGIHYCLSAPGTVRGLVPNADRPGRGTVQDGLFGTSFAAPVVSGALALLMEHFRGTRGNTEVVRRMLDTADRSGHYADLETYGAGHLDLEAALSPVGALNAGQSSRGLQQSSLQLPAIFGDVTSRVGGAEFAAFDEQDFPFWVSLSSTMFQRPAWRSTIPEFANPMTQAVPATGLESLGLQWNRLPNQGNVDEANGQEWIAGFGQGTVSFARRPKQSGLGYGFSFNDGNYFGARASGAFGQTLRSGMVWSSSTVEHHFTESLTFRATGTLGMSLPQYERRAIFQASPSLLSAVSLRVGTPGTGLTVVQPLRAETGTGTFRLENGIIHDGRRQYETHRVALSPTSREVRFMVHHERQMMGGRLAAEAGTTFNVGHIPGRQDSRMGVVYRLIW